VAGNESEKKQDGEALAENKQGFFHKINALIIKLFVETEEEKKQRQEAAAQREKVKIPFKQIAIVLVIALVASMVIVFVFDLTGLRTSAIDKVTALLIPKQREALVEQLQAEYEQQMNVQIEMLLQDEREKLEQAQKELSDAKTAQAQEEAEIESAKEALSRREQELEEQVQMLEQEREDFLAYQGDIQTYAEQVQALCKLYESMEPQSAVEIIEAMKDEALVTDIMRQMKKESAAAIFELMETQKAADIIRRMGE